LKDETLKRNPDGGEIKDHILSSYLHMGQSVETLHLQTDILHFLHYLLYIFKLQ